MRRLGAGMTAITFSGFCERPASSRGAMMTTFSDQAAESEINQPDFWLLNLATPGPGTIGTGPVER